MNGSGAIVSETTTTQSDPAGPAQEPPREPLIKDLTVQNYRGFSKFTMSGLKRVNLLVGENGGGKTSLLEAVWLLLSEGDGRTWKQVAWRRGERGTDGSVGPSARELHPTCAGFFHQQKLDEDWPIRILSGGMSLTAAVTGPEMIASLDFELEGRGYPWRLDDPNGGPQVRYQFPISSSLTFPPVMGRPRTEYGPPVRFLSSQLLTDQERSETWDVLLKNLDEGRVGEALNLLRDDVDSVVLQATVGQDVLIGLNGQKTRVPIGSLGEGLQRMFDISSSLLSVRGGCALIDEIDSGLHWTVMGDLWHLIVGTATKFDTQVFLTTHSADCLRGLGWLAENHPELAEQVSIQSIRRGRDHSYVFDGDRASLILDQNIEVR